MAKNLKLNVKNTQLAEALKLSQPKKPSPKKEKSEAVSEEVSVPEVPPAPAPSIPQEAPKAQEEIVKPVEEAPAPKKILPGFVKREPYTSGRPPLRQPQERSADDRPYPRREDQGYTPREGQAPYPRREGQSYTPREGQAPYPRREGQGYTPREGQAPYPRREGQGYTPREGQAPYPRREGQGYTPREGQAPYPRREGQGYTPREGQAPYPRREGQGYTPREGQAPYPRREGQGYTPREGQAPYPRREGQAPYPRRDTPPGAPRPPFRREGASDFRPEARRALPPIKEPGKEIPQQQQQHKKPNTYGSSDRDAKVQKKSEIERSFDARDRQGLRTVDDELWRKKKNFKSKQQIADEVIRPKELKVRLPITVKDLAAEMKLKASQLIAKLFMQGVVITLNDYLDDETTVQLLGHEFECDITIDTKEEERIRVTDRTIKEEIEKTDPSLLELRPPVVTFMGHVDHGKTSLIDTIRKSNVAASESGAITQHIGAFKCQTPVGLITVLDTPGHEAFSSMRERGADVTDIVVLVVAGDEGIKMQTVEAINQAKQAGVPLVVAINKCDKPNFDPETVYRQLAEQNLLPEAWGGSIITVNCSAVTGEGVKELLEMLALQAEVLEIKANPQSRARGSVIESELHKGLGPVATILVQNGTLHVGDALVFDQLYARVKTMHDEHGKELLDAPPSTPVKITGLSGLPLAGSEFVVVKSEKEAREISEKRKEEHTTSLQLAKKTSMESLLQSKAESSEKKTLKLILKADVQGSLEALKTSLRKLPNKKVEILFISKGVGEVSESDIQYAATSKATIIGFHTVVESHAESLIKQTKTDVRLHDIIYHAVDDVREIMLGLLDKIPKENEMGEATVKAVFKSSQIGNIAGCIVNEGTLRRNCHARLIRNKEVIWKGPIASLKRNKEDVKEVQKGLECGIVLQGFSDFKENDLIQAYEIIYLQQELE